MRAGNSGEMGNFEEKNANLTNAIPKITFVGSIIQSDNGEVLKKIRGLVLREGGGGDWEFGGWGVGI